MGIELAEPAHSPPGCSVFLDDLYAAGDGIDDGVGDRLFVARVRTASERLLRKGDAVREAVGVVVADLVCRLLLEEKEAGHGGVESMRPEQRRSEHLEHTGNVELQHS